MDSYWDRSWCNKGHLLLLKALHPKGNGDTEVEVEEEEEEKEGEHQLSKSFPSGGMKPSWDEEEGNGNMHAFYEDKQLDPVIVL